MQIILAAISLNMPEFQAVPNHYNETALNCRHIERVVVVSEVCNRTTTTATDFILMRLIINSYTNNLWITIF